MPIAGNLLTTAMAVMPQTDVQQALVVLANWRISDIPLALRAEF